MRQLCTIIFIISILLIPSPGQTTMNPLSNSSLREVQIGESETTGQEGPDEKPGITALHQQPLENKHTVPATDDKTRLELFRKCKDYQNFLSFLQELNRISKNRKYSELIKTEKFLSFCSDLAGTSYRCKKKLFSLNLQDKNNTKIAILKIHQDLFRQATLFYKLVYQHQKQNKPVPDLNQFLTQIQTGLTAIDAEYAEL